MTRSDLLALMKQCDLDAAAATSAVSLDFLRQSLVDRQTRGLYPAFAEKDPDKRIHAASVLPSAKVVLTAALAYRTSEHPPSSGSLPPLRGSLSRYARSSDYHQILSKRLTMLAESLRKYVPLKDFRVAVDSTPLTERAWALVSGLGVQRWNSCLYVQPYGSYVFLGELVMDVDPRAFPLETEERNRDDTCQQCQRCLRACPTQALSRSFALNPRKCLAYWTQAKEPIPRDLRPHWGTTLWGCDICQDVCPHNQQAVPSLQSAMVPILPPQLPLQTVLNLTNRSFRQLFGGTAASWRGRGVLQRNAAMVLGTFRDPQTIPWLMDILRHHPQPLVRGSSAWALGQMHTHSASRLLSSALKTETDSLVRDEIEYSLIS